MGAKRVTVSDPSPSLEPQEPNSHLSSFEAQGGAAHSPTPGHPVEGTGPAPPCWTSAGQLPMSLFAQREMRPELRVLVLAVRLSDTSPGITLLPTPLGACQDLLVFQSL